MTTEKNRLPKEYEKEKMASDLRGQIIHSAVIMEAKMDLIIAYFFTQNEKRSNELAHLMLQSDRFTVMNKKNVVHYIIQNYFPEYYKKYPLLEKHMNELILIRNSFAHKLFISVAQLEKDGIILHKFKTKENKLKVDPEKFSAKKLKEIKDNFELVVKLLNEIAYKLKK